jgi:hypothetical protein
MPENPELKELKSIKKLLVLIALRSGASPENIDEATGMGAGNIRAMFPEKKTNGTLPSSTEGTMVST